MSSLMRAKVKHIYNIIINENLSLAYYNVIINENLSLAYYNVIINES